MRAIVRFRITLLSLALTAALAGVHAIDLVEASALRPVDALALMSGGLAIGAFIALARRGPRPPHDP